MAIKLNTNIMKENEYLCDKGCDILGQTIQVVVVDNNVEEKEIYAFYGKDAVEKAMKLISNLFDEWEVKFDWDNDIFEEALYDMCNGNWIDWTTVTIK